MTRVFLAVRHSAEPNAFYGGLWSSQFCQALGALGCEVVESKVDLLPSSRFMHVGGGFTAEELECRAGITERILAELREAHALRPVDLFLSYFYNAHFDPSGYSEVRRLGIPSVNFYCNSLYQFDLVRAVASACDFAWHSEKAAREHYLSAGARPVWVQMGADPVACSPVSGTVRKPAVCFVGQRYADRDRWIAALVGHEIPVELYGRGWGAEAPAPAGPDSAQPQEYLGRRMVAPGTAGAYLAVIRENWAREGLVGGSVRTLRQALYRRESSRLGPVLSSIARGPAASLRHAFSGSEVVLNLSNVWSDGRAGSRLIPHVRLRDFEAPLCRSCYLTQDTEEIAEFYDVGREIATFRTVDELVDKCRFFLGHPESAERLREAGHRRALACHTWERRFESLFELIGLGARAGQGSRHP